MNVPVPILILLTTLSTIGSQLILKRVMLQIAPILRESGPMAFLWSAATSPLVVLALSFQVFGYVVWFFVLAKEKLSVAFALSGSFFYLVMAAASWMFFGERLNGYQWVGLFLISAGVVMVTVLGEGA